MDLKMEIEEPPALKLKRSFSRNSIIAMKRSYRVLESLKYDPIAELVGKYKDLENELERQKLIRENKVVELTATGRIRSFNPEIMLSIYDKQISIAEKLLRYKYGRVPEIENLNENNKSVPFIVNLTKKGETYVVNDKDLQDDDLDSELNT